MHIREMTIADFDAVIAFWKTIQGIGLNDSDTRPAIETYLRRNPGLSFVITDGAGGIIGAVLCGHDGRRGYLHHLAVAPAHRGQGLGRQLVELCLERLATERIAKCNIFLFADNSAGERFWNAIGWSGRLDLKVLQRPV